MAGDLDRLAAALAPLEAEAARLPWAAERPWRVRSHLWREGSLPVVDLHDLDVRCARRAVDAVAEVAEGLDAGAVSFVVGRGRHSRGPRRLGPAVGGALGHVARQRGWGHGPAQPGRLVLVIDPARAPAAATGRLGPAFWLGALAFSLAALVVLPPLGAALLLVLGALAALSWRERRRLR